MPTGNETDGIRSFSIGLPQAGFASVGLGIKLIGLPLPVMEAADRDKSADEAQVIALGIISGGGKETPPWVTPMIISVARNVAAQCEYP